MILQFGCTGSVGDVSKTGSSREALRLTAVNVDASEPDIAADDKGDLYVVYVEHQDAQNADIRFLKLDNSGDKVGEPIRVNTEAGSAKVWAGDPPKIAVRGRDVYVTWTRKYPDRSARGNDLVLSVSRDSGSTFEPPVKVNDDAAPASHGMHSLALGSNDDVIVLWLDERSLVGRPAPMASNHEMAEPNAEVYYALSNDGGRSFGLNTKLSEEVCPCCKTTLLADQDGAIFAAWRQVVGGEYRHIALARSYDGGQTFNKPVIVSDDKWQISACPVSGAALAAPRAGTIDVLWYTAGNAGQAGLYFARSTDKGDSFAPRILLSNEAKPGTPSVATLREREFVVFSIADGRVASSQWENSPTSQTTRSVISDAVLPSATASAGQFRTVFVRKVDSKRSVWVQ